MAEYQFSDSADLDWVDIDAAPGVQFKTLGKANGQTIELYKFPPNTGYPDHRHAGAEFVYMLEGSARQDGRWLEAGSASAAEAGTKDLDFLSGPDGCVLVTVYTESIYDI